MNAAVFINTQGSMDHTYIGNLYNQPVVIYARSQSQAKQLAIEHFKPKKKDLQHINVSLHTINVEPISFIEEAGNA